MFSTRRILVASILGPFSVVIPIAVWSLVSVIFDRCIKGWSCDWVFIIFSVSWMVVPAYISLVAFFLCASFFLRRQKRLSRSALLRVSVAPALAIGIIFSLSGYFDLPSFLLNLALFSIISTVVFLVVAWTWWEVLLR